MIDWLQKLDLPPPKTDGRLPAEKIDQDDEDQTELTDYENGE